MSLSPKNKNDLEAMVNAKAWKDPQFKKKLLADPKTALQEMGIETSQGITFRVIEEDTNTVILILHQTPEDAAQMGDEELKKVAGGAGSGGCCQVHVAKTRPTH